MLITTGRIYVPKFFIAAGSILAVAAIVSFPNVQFWHLHRQSRLRICPAISVPHIWLGLAGCFRESKDAAMVSELGQLVLLALSNPLYCAGHAAAALSSGYAGRTYGRGGWHMG